MDLRHVTLHGHDVGYRMAGEGPVVLRIPGMDAYSLRLSGPWLPALEAALVLRGS